MALLSPEGIEQVKRSHDLVAVVREHGVELKKRGKDWIGLCPFHEETAPSFTVNSRRQLYHCFGCAPNGETGGDVITFVSRIRGIPFREALAYLDCTTGTNGAAIKGRASRPAAPRETEAAPSRPADPRPSSLTARPDGRGPDGLSAEQQKLLARVVRFYRAGFASDPRGRAYLAERGIRDADALEAFGVGYVAGNLVEALPQDGDLEGALRELGVLNKRGRECFHGCVVFPLLDPASGAPVGLYGRRTEDGEVAHLYLAGPRRGLVNAGAAKRSKSVLLAESVIDALSLYANGFRNVIPCYGTQGFLSLHEEHLVQHGVEEAYVVFDADAPGREAAALVAERLTARNIRPYVVELPEKDPNSFFLRHTPEELEALLKRANPRTLERSAQVTKRGETRFEETAHGFVVVFGTRRYEVKGITRSATQLRVTLRADLEPGPDGPPQAVGGRMAEVTTVDLYSSRNREQNAKVLARVFGEAEPLVREDLMRLVEKAEAHEAVAAARATETPAVKLTEAERTEALSLLTAPDLERRIVDDLTTMGLTGEETNKLLGYLVATSRKLPQPLSMVIQSRSGAGKSALQDAVLSLIPPEDLCKYTRITDQALFYREGSSLEHKVLALEEAEGMGGAVYSLRALQSAGEVSILSTGKNPQTGQLESREAVVKGPVALFMTTTRPSTEVDGELASRNLFTTVDESRERTAAILEAQRERWTLEGRRKALSREAVQRRHRNAQRLLEPLEVVNGYADQLRFPPDSLRARRDHAKYLSIIAAIAFLKQHSRPIHQEALPGGGVMRFVEVVRGDIGLANELAREVLAASMDELSPPSRQLAELIRERVLAQAASEGGEPDELGFTRREVREWTGWSDFQVKVHLAELVELEYLVVRQGRKGREYVYALPASSLIDGERFRLVLTPVEELVDPPPLVPGALSDVDDGDDAGGAGGSDA